MDKRQKALDALKEQIRQQREKLDPKLLKMAELAIRGRLPDSGAAGSVPAGTVPYDQKTAAAAVEAFLKNHPDAKGFRARLLELIRKTQH